MIKPVQDFSLHTHTIGFDGRDTPIRMILHARSIGMKSLGVSNHFIVHPEINKAKFYPYAVSGGYASIYSSSFDDAIAKFKPHYKELKKLSGLAGVRVYRGMEVDYFDSPAWRKGFERAIRILKPDYIICASHFIEYDGMLCNVHDMANASPQTRDKMLRLYWGKLGRAAKTGMFNWIAHLDLPKKVGVGCEVSWGDTESVVIDAIAKSETPIEINTGLYRPYCDEPYPSPRILKMVAAANIPVLLSDDAHAAEQMGRHFSRAYELAKTYGVTRFLSCDEAVRSR